MVDIHNHILYGIDDGAEDIDDSVQMCRDAYDNGFKEIVVTPHFAHYEDIDLFVEKRNEKIKKLRNALVKEEIPLKVYSGAEIYLTDEIFEAENLDDLTINHSRYILCEFSLGPFDASHVPMWFDELIDRGYTPILAHPERYFTFHRDFRLIDELLDRDIVFQVTFDSLTGRNGEKPQMMGVDMVCRGIAQLIGTDAHDPIFRNNHIKDRMDFLPDEITQDLLETCLIKNPRLILKDMDI